MENLINIQVFNELLGAWPTQGRLILGFKPCRASAEPMTQLLDRSSKQPGMAGSIQSKLLFDLLPARFGNLRGNFWMTTVVPIKINQFINRVINGDMLLVEKEAPPP